MIRIKTLCFVVLSIMLCTANYAANYYCSPTGTDNGSSPTKPGSFATGLSNLATIDTLYLMGGQYDFSVKQTISKSGTPEKYKVVAAYPGEKPILDFRNEPYGERGISISDGTMYVHLKGLVVRYTGKNAIINYGSYCKLEKLEVYGNGDTGIQHKTGHSNYILNCDSHDNFDYQSMSGSTADFGGNADGFADKQYTGGGNTYEGCRAWNNSDDGWDFYQHVTGSYGATVFRNCVCYKNGPAYYDLSGNPRLDNADKAWMDKKEGTSIKNRYSETVTIKRSAYPNMGNGNGFKLGGDYTTHKAQLYNCLSVGNSVRGYDQNNNAGEMEIYNCSAYNNGIDYGFSKITNSSLTIKNCLTLASIGSNSFNCPTLVTSNNSWNTNGVSCTSADFESLDSTLVLYPRQPDGSLTVTQFMRLKEGSSLIDAGVKIGSEPYSGSAPDLGCFEYGELVYPAAVTAPSNNKQTVKEGNSIQNMVYIWSGEATGLTVSNLPNGLTSTINNTDKTLTISGTPTESGTFTVTTVNEGDQATAIGTVTVKSASSLKVAYVTIPNSSSDTKMLDAIETIDNVYIEILDASTSHDIKSASYDLVIIAPAPGSKSIGVQLSALNNLDYDCPTLLLKPWMFKSGVWSIGTPVNTSEKGVTLTSDGATHPIFTGVDVSNIFTTVNTNGITGISAWTNNAPSKILAQSGEYDVIVEAKAGETIGSLTLKNDLLVIGVSEYSTANLSESGTRLISNAVRYSLGLAIPTTIESTVKNCRKIISNENHIIVESDEIVENLSLYNMGGQKISTANKNEISVQNLCSGAYVLQVRTTNGISDFYKIWK